jgi:hypothetical protein
MVPSDKSHRQKPPIPQAPIIVRANMYVIAVVSLVRVMVPGYTSCSPRHLFWN